MKRIMFVILLWFCAFNAQAQSISGPPFIAVHGKAKAEVIPDLFPLEVTLKDTSVDTAATQARIEGLAQQVVALTKTMGMADRDVEISNLSISPEYQWDEKEDKQLFLGNTYTRTIKLRFHTLGDLQKAIDAMPKTKQVQLDTGSFQSSRQDDIRRELLTQAVKDARETAEIMAGAVGRRIGGVHNVSNQGFNVRYVTSDESGSLDSVVVSGSRQAAPAPPVVLREGVIQLDQNT